MGGGICDGVGKSRRVRRIYTGAFSHFDLEGDNMFGFLKGKKPNGFEAFEDRAFRVWGVSRANHAQRLRLRLAFVASAVTIIQSKAGRSGGALIEKIQTDLVRSSRDLDVLIGDLFDVDVPSHSIDFSVESFLLAVAPPGSGLGEATKLNGLAAIDGLFGAFGQEGASWVHEKSQGPFGAMGAAALLLHDLAVGGRSDGPSSMLVAKDFMQTLAEVTK